MQWLSWSLWVIVALVVWQLWPVWYGLLWLRRLIDVPLPADGEELPSISVIVPALNEADGIEPSLRSLLALDYPHLEIIAVDDRSTDDTGTIMDRVAAADPRCRVIHITELPAGWLGKNHANSAGARHASGELILFTDGDVVFAPDALLRSAAAMQRAKLDHLALLPDAMMTTFGEQLMMNYFVLQIAVVTRMWITHFSRRAFVGIGAFNMIRRTAYERIGGHEPLRMEVADDLMLGKLVKQAGLRQDLLSGTPLLRVKWQTGLWGIIRGLEKNAFAGTRYSVTILVVGILAHLLSAFLPIVLTILGSVCHSRPMLLPAAMWLVLATGTHVAMAARNHYRLLAGLLFPLTSVIFCYALIRSAHRTIRDGGVRWRETFYPLAELRAGMIEWHPLGGLLRARR